MKFLICGDVHWSEFSSILRKMGDKYSKRLENLINSINWVEEQAKEIKSRLEQYLNRYNM